MSFNLNRINNQISKKNITISNTINSNSLKSSVGSTGSASIANITALTLNGSNINVNANQINKTQINTTGIAEPSKVLVLDNNTNKQWVILLGKKISTNELIYITKIKCTLY